MARNVTLAKLRGLARLYANQRPNGADAFTPDVATSIDTAGVNDLINLALTEVYDLLVAARGHEYYRKSATVTLVAGTPTYSLPLDLYQLLTMTLEWSATEFENVQDLNSLNDRAQFNNFSYWTPWAPKAFRLSTLVVELLPTPTSTPVCRLQYIPSFTDLTDDAQVFDGVNGWEKLVALRVAIELRTAAEQESTELSGLYQSEHQRIVDMASDRAALAAKTVKDIAPEGPMVWPVVRRRDP